MKIFVKTLALITITAFFHNTSFAQLKLLPESPLGNDVKKVIEDYPNHFKSLMGELIVQHSQSTDYRCNFKVNGAEEAIITSYSSSVKDIRSWQALMLTTESFEKAKQKFRSLFNQLNNLSVNSFHLKGSWETPLEEKKFTSVLFSFLPPGETLQKLKVEISMEYELLEWKVKVMVYDREREDFERGLIREE